MELYAFVLFITFCSSVRTFSLPYGTEEFKNNSNLSSVDRNSDRACETDKCKESECKCCPGYGVFKDAVFFVEIKKCKKCDCGSNYSCTFSGKTGKKCICPDGYVDKGGKCTPKYLCNGVKCYNGGKCDTESGKCDCSSTEYKGEKCEEVKDDECLEKMEKCHVTRGKCVTKDSGENIECVCPFDLGYFEEEGCKDLCQGIECYNGGKCDTRSGRCDCSKTAYIGEKCEELKDDNCQEKMEKCHSTRGKCITKDFGANIECVCPFDLGYSETEGCTDKGCDTGECKKSKCNCCPGYGLLKKSIWQVIGSDKCLKCNCGSNYNCTFSISNSKKCICPEGYEDKGGKCTHRHVCNDDNQCFNGAKCKSSEDGSLKNCHCLQGTSGPFCKNIMDCQTLECGTDATCAYDTDKKSAYCKCTDQEQIFDDGDKKCKPTCKSSEDGSLKNCDCLLGTNGPFCKIIIDCQTLECGTDATCAYDTDESSAYCKCIDPEQIFDDGDKKCKHVCNDANECFNGAKCKSSEYGSIKNCHCLQGTSGPFCKNIIDCQTLECGTGATCAYDTDKNSVYCRCTDPEQIFDEGDKKCKHVCKDDGECFNGAKCKSSEDGSLKNCHCLQGTNGAFCKNIMDCQTLECGTDAICAYDTNKNSAYCKCTDQEQIFDDGDKKCKLMEDTCKQKKKECMETGGSCKLKPTGLECVCPKTTQYFKNAGCQVTVGRCQKIKPKCEYTGGRCLFYLWDYNYVECACPTGYEYTEDDGCIDLSMPRNLIATCISNTSICLKWNEPTVWKTPILFYEIHWLNSNSSGRERSISNSTSHTMKHLVPFVEYSFRVAAVTKTGTGKISEKLDVRTAVGVPHAPRNLTVTKMTNTTAELNWNEPLISTGPIITYRVRWQNSSSTGEEGTQSAATFYIVRNLTPNVNYSFEVTALTAAGPGEWSRRVTGQTKLGVSDLTSLDDPDDDIVISVFFKNRSLSTDSKLDFHFSRKETSNRTITQLLLRLNSASVVRQPENKCSLISCKNGGTCDVKNDKAVCTCLEEYTGDHCEKSKCSLIKCQNNGKCLLKNGKAICSCTDYFSGEYCENHKCSLIKCKNGGECEVKYGKPVCICPDNYTDDYCETDKCSLVGCKNGGNCYITNGKAICNCLDNYTGDLCETDKCSQIRCHNGGKCGVKNGKAVCMCSDQYIGDFCEIEKCSLIRCLNGGKCEIKNQKALCICSDEFTGDYCEKRLISKDIFRTE